QEDRKEDKLLDLYLPIGLLAFGLVISVLRLTKFGVVVYPVGQAVTMAAMEFVISMVLLTIGCLLAMRVAEVAFGSPGPAALKVAAIAVAPAAVSKIADYMLNDPFGVVGFFLAFGMFFGLFTYLFDLDQSEIWILAGMTTVVQMFAATAIMMALAGGMGLPGMDKIGRGGTTNDDKVVANLNEIGRLKNARDWMAESKGRILGELTREDSELFINDLYGITPTVEVLPEGPQGMAVVVKLPSSASKRKAVFDAHKAFANKHKLAVTDDVGQKHLLIRFGFFQEPQMGFGAAPADTQPAWSAPARLAA
ncbi:MAG TPA: hypothetical protein VER17_20945, partial [Tepidisphaeraceae bacterium]|nr:hypothetical protein [Tepidisphaeraceae bacterium]